VFFVGGTGTKVLALLLYKNENIDTEGGAAGKSWKWEGGGEAFERWKEGQTGQPLVDAQFTCFTATKVRILTQKGTR
jgi:deoxyribodipyrimidine photolyase